MSVFVCEFIDEESRHGLGIEVCQKFLELLLRMDAQPPLGALNNPSCDADKICVEKALHLVPAHAVIAELKRQLDNYGAFYQGLLDYTGAVSDAADGARTLKLNMDTLASNTGTLKLSVGELSDAAGQLYGGTKDLTSGTSEFAAEASDMDKQISDEIDSMTSSITGGDGETVSFVSDKNTRVDSVQFVIKTAAIEKAEATVSDTVEEAPLTFWQKLLRLFGLY